MLLSITKLHFISSRNNDASLYLMESIWIVVCTIDYNYRYTDSFYRIVWTNVTFETVTTMLCSQRSDINKTNYFDCALSWMSFGFNYVIYRTIVWKYILNFAANYLIHYVLILFIQLNHNADFSLNQLYWK